MLSSVKKWTSNSVNKAIMGPSNIIILINNNNNNNNNNCFVNYIHATGSNTTVTTMRDYHGNHNPWLLIQLIKFIVEKEVKSAIPVFELVRVIRATSVTHKIAFYFNLMYIFLTPVDVRLKLFTDLSSSHVHCIGGAHLSLLFAKYN
jgi:hypothetical protein